MTTAALPATAFPSLDALASRLVHPGSENLFPKIIEECQRLTREGHSQDDLNAALAAWEDFFR
ncbi:MAG: hypothetical protein WCO00_13685 [Rhodospirillaceae bacterium]